MGMTHLKEILNLFAYHQATVHIPLFEKY